MQLPKPVLAALIISLAIGVFLIMEPPHTICDTQRENIQKGMEGVLFPIKVGKETVPGRIHKAMEVCHFGNSGGACFEYFDILRKTSRSVKEASAECAAGILGVPIAKYAKFEEYQKVTDKNGMRKELAAVTYRQATLEQVLWDGFEIMIMKAWGTSPPPPGAQRFGWFRESEMNAFCHVRDVLLNAKGRAALLARAQKIYPKLPGEEPQRDIAGMGLEGAPPPRPATQTMREPEIYERSLLSAPCDYFR